MVTKAEKLLTTIDESISASELNSLKGTTPVIKRAIKDAKASLDSFNKTGSKDDLISYHQSMSNIYNMEMKELIDSGDEDRDFIKELRSKSDTHSSQAMRIARSK